MKSRPQIGAVGTLTVQTEAKHAVEFAGNGMPAVLSTPNLIGFLERTARGRAGFTVDNWLFYGTGGFAWSEGTESRTQVVSVASVPPIPAPGGTVESVSNTRTGWTAGAGVEWGLTQNWTARVEYLYLDLGSATSVFTSMKVRSGSGPRCLTRFPSRIPLLSLRRSWRS